MQYERDKKVHATSECRGFSLYKTNVPNDKGHTVFVAKLTRGAHPAAIAFCKGQVLHVVHEGKVRSLVVTFTTPARYYRPGTTVATCLVGTSCLD